MDFKDFPPSVKEILVSDDSIEANEKIIADFSLSEAQTDELFDVLRQITFGILPMGLLPEALKEKLAFDEEKSQRAAAEIAGLRFLALSDFLKVNVEALIKKWGGDAEKFHGQMAKRYELRKKLEREIKPIPAKIIFSPELTEEERKAEMVARVAELSFADENLKRRFRNVIVSHLKEVRNEEQMKETLGRSAKVGGLGYDEGKVSSIIAVLEEMKKIELSPVPPAVPADTSAAERRMAEKAEETKALEPAENHAQSTGGNFRKDSGKTEEYLPAAEEELLLPAPPSLSRPGGEIAASHPGQLLPPSEAREEGQKIGGKKDIFPEATEEYAKEGAGEAEKIAPFSAAARLELIGPVKEIRDLKLIDFRRLSGNPRQAAEKIKQKVDILEKDSILKKISGIKAWQDSETYRLYIRMGYEILLENKSLEEIIASRKEKNQPALSAEEFYAIADLNSKMRF